MEILLGISLLIQVFISWLIFKELKKIKNTPRLEARVNNLTEEYKPIPPRTDKEQWRICQRRKGLPTGD